MGISIRVLISCCVAMIAALLVVGAVSHEVIRHIVDISALGRHRTWYPSLRLDQMGSAAVLCLRELSRSGSNRHA